MRKVVTQRSWAASVNVDLLQEDDDQKCRCDAWPYDAENPDIDLFVRQAKPIRAALKQANAAVEYRVDAVDLRTLH